MDILVSPPSAYARIFEVLNWGRGEKIFFSEFNSFSKHGLRNAAAISRVLADKYDGIIWDKTNQVWGNPNTEEILANSGSLHEWLSEIGNILANNEKTRSKPDLKLV